MIVVAAVSVIAAATLLLGGDPGAAQRRSGAAPDLSLVVRTIANGKATTFAQTAKAKPGDLVQLRVLVRNYKSSGGSRIALAVDRGPSKQLSASVSSGGGAPKGVSVSSASGDAIALGTLRFNCVAPPTFCPVKFTKPGKQWRGSYTAPSTNDFAIFTATVVKPADRP
jgi:hypothetical protein